MNEPFSTRLNIRIHHHDDSFVITGDDIESIRELALTEIKKRGWKEANCWSEDIGTGFIDSISRRRNWHNED